MTPQLALRVAILGGIAFALFAIVFLRLWFLQVLTGDQYRQDALDNRVRTVAISAPRGSILDRDGHARSSRTASRRSSSSIRASSRRPSATTPRPGVRR